MASSQLEKSRTHSQLVEIAARRFKEGGLERLSIADLMSEAGLTHGGFYKHFNSRDALVAEAILEALKKKPINRDRSFDSLVEGYLSKSHRDDVGSGCTVCALMNDIGHAPSAARATYTEQVKSDIEILEAALAKQSGGDQAEAGIFALAALVGALGLARAVSDPSLSDQILSAVTWQLGTLQRREQTQRAAET